MISVYLLREYSNMKYLNTDYILYRETWKPFQMNSGAQIQMSPIYRITFE